MTGRDGFGAAVAVIGAPFLLAFGSAVLPMSRAPDLLMLLAVWLGWRTDLWTAIPTAFVIGFMEDLATGRGLMVRATSLAVASLIAVYIRGVINQENPLSKALAGILAAGIADPLAWGLLRWSGFAISASHFQKAIWIPGILWASALMIPTDACLRRLVDLLCRMWPSVGGRKEAAM